jgi:hypothetical protein
MSVKSQGRARLQVDAFGWHSFTVQVTNAQNTLLKAMRNHRHCTCSHVCGAAVV